MLYHTCIIRLLLPSLLQIELANHHNRLCTVRYIVPQPYRTCRTTAAPSPPPPPSSCTPSSYGTEASSSLFSQLRYCTVANNRIEQTNRARHTVLHRTPCSITGHQPREKCLCLLQYRCTVRYTDNLRTHSPRSRCIFPLLANLHSLIPPPPTRVRPKTAPTRRIPSNNKITPVPLPLPLDDSPHPTSTTFPHSLALPDLRTVLYCIFCLVIHAIPPCFTNLS